MTELVIYPEKLIIPTIVADESKFISTGWVWQQISTLQQSLQGLPTTYGAKHVPGYSNILQYKLHRSTATTIKVIYTIEKSQGGTNPFSGAVQLYYGGTLGTLRTVAGTYTELITLGTTDNIFGFIADYGSTPFYIFDGRISSVKIITTEFLDINQELDFMINRAIKDPVMPSIIANDFSESITLPGTHNNNNILRDIFDFGLLIDYPIDKIINCNILIDSLPVFRGVSGIFQLVSVKKTGDLIEYDCDIYGSIKTIFTTLGEKLLSELDLSAYDHDYNIANIMATWDKDIAGTLGEGYYYPLINYGNNWNLQYLQNNDILSLGLFYPAIFIKQYIDAMFLEAGFSYVSTFFNTIEFKKLHIPYCNEDKILQILPCCYVGLTASQLIPIGIGSIVHFDDETTPFFDSIPIGGSFATYRFTAPTTGRYNLTIQLDYSTTDDSVTSHLNIYKNAITHLFTDNMKDNDIYIFNHTVDLVAGDILSWEVNDPTGTIAITLNNGIDDEGTWVKMDFLGIWPGYTTIEINKIVPNMSCANLLLNIIKAFNLIILPTENKNEYYIEPYKDYADTGIIRDWTKKLCQEKPIINNIHKDGLSRISSFNFYDEKDELYYKQQCDAITNNYFNNILNKLPGSLSYLSNDETLEDENIVQLDFAVPVIKPIGDIIGWVVPHLFEIIDGNAHIYGTQKTGWQPRMMYFHKTEETTAILLNGVLDNTCATSSVFLDNNNQTDITNRALLFNVRNIDEYFSPVTNNTLYNLYYKKFIDEIYSKNSRLITAYFNLDNYEFHSMQLKDVIFIDGLTDRCVDINFNLNKNEPTKVTLLKIANGIDYTYPLTVDPWNVPLPYNNIPAMRFAAPVVINSVDIKQLFSSPYLAIKGVPGYIIDIISIIGILKYNSINYDLPPADQILIAHEGAAAACWTLPNELITSGAAICYKAEKRTGLANNEMIVGAGIQIGTIADPGLGDSNIEFHFLYRLVKKE